MKQQAINLLAIIFALIGFGIGFALTGATECGVIAGSSAGIATILIGICTSNK